MKAKYSEGLHQDLFHIRSAKNSLRENSVEFESIYKSGDFSFSYKWDWASVPEPISDYQISGVACGIDGNVYIATRFTDHPVAVFNKDGEFQRYVGSGLEVGQVHGISVDGEGCIWLADSRNHVCRKLSPSGQLLMTLGSFEQPSNSGVDMNFDFGKSRYLTVKRRAGPFNGPTKLVTAPNGHLYAADGHWNSAVHRFAADGTLLGSWGSPGSKEGEFHVVHALAADDESRIWVVDKENNRVQVFSSSGDHLTVLDRLMAPSDIAIGGGYAYASEIDGRISVYDMDFNLVAQIGAVGGEFHGHSIAVDADGNLYLGQMYANYHLSKLERLNGVVINHG